MHDTENQYQGTILGFLLFELNMLLVRLRMPARFCQSRIRTFFAYPIQFPNNTPLTGLTSRILSLPSKNRLFAKASAIHRLVHNKNTHAHNRLPTLTITESPQRAINRSMSIPTGWTPQKENSVRRW